MADKEDLARYIADTLRKEIAIDAPPQRVISSSSFRKTRSRTTKAVYRPLKILFSRKEIRGSSTFTAFYIGGDRRIPTKIFEVESDLSSYQVFLENTGKKQDNWIFNLLQYQQQAVTVICISPQFPEHNWEVERVSLGLSLSGDLRFVGGGTWAKAATPVGQPMRLNVNTISVSPRVDEITAFVTSEAEALWREANYNIPLDFSSQTVITGINNKHDRFCEHNLSWVFLSKGISFVTQGKIWYTLSFIDGSWRLEPLEFFLSYTLLPTIIKQEFSTDFYPVLVNPSVDKVIYRQLKLSAPQSSVTSVTGQQKIIVSSSDIELTGDRIGFGTWINDTIYSPVSGGRIRKDPFFPISNSKMIENIINTGITVHRINNNVAQKDSSVLKIKNVYPIADVDDASLTLHSASYYPANAL